MSIYVGIDVGTSSLKVSVAADGGGVLARARRPYQQKSGSGGQNEQDPGAWLTALRHALRDCGPCVGHAEGVGIVGQTPTLVAVGANGRPVRPAMSWQDSRAVLEADDLEQELGDSAQLVGTRLPWSPTQLPAKLRWLATHEPGTVAATRWVLQPKDFLGLRLTGEPSSDAWSSKGLCDVRDGTPATRILRACGWPVDAVPATDAPWSQRGVVTTEAGVEFGLRPGTPVAIGWSDALAAMLAVGVFDEPSAFVLTGTSQIVGISTASVPEEVAGLYNVPMSCAPLELLYGPTQSSGAAVEWVARITNRSTEEALAAVENATSATPTPTFVPYIDGERAPLWRSDVRGVFLGLASGHQAPDLTRAVLTGVALSARHVLSLATAAVELEPDVIHVGGRGVSTDPWASTWLRSLGIPIALHDDSSLSALGAAMLGAAAAGRPLGTTSLLREQGTRMSPMPEEVAQARDMFATYLRASQAAQAWTST